jgi:predicted DNA-binding transcriptional regulator YafY
VISTSARLLRLVSLLSTRPAWTNRDLAERMEVTERTIRRDIAKLRDLGYGIDSDAGPWGGYRLSAGTTVPPLSLDDEEAFAVAVALREVGLSGVLGSDQAAMSALLKLQRLLPARLARRLAQLDGAFVHTPRPVERHGRPAVLLELATACREGARVRLSYRDMNGKDTVREIDPYQLVRTSHRWYLVALDVARGQWRTFRVDRATEARTIGQSRSITHPPDAALLVARMLTSNYPLYTKVRFPVPLERALELVPPNRGVHEADGGDATVVTIGGSDADELTTYLLSLATPLRVLSPDDVRDEVRRRTRELLVENETDD